MLREKGCMKNTLTAILICLAACGCQSNAHNGEPDRSSKTGTTKALQTPQDLTEASACLKQTLSPDDLKLIKADRESQMLDYTYTLGIWIVNNWLRGDTPLERFFVSHGVNDPEDMAGIIMTSLWRDVHGVPINAEAQFTKNKTAEMQSN